MTEGRLLVLEGLDGSGITTQTELLRMWCEKHGIPVYVTKEPSDGPSGGVIKQALRHRLQGLHGESMALLFAADRQDHVTTEILPALASGLTVICDRYYLSSFAYQHLEVDDLEWLKAINSKCPTPELTIYLDVPPKKCLERMTSDAWRGSDQLQLYEELEYLNQIHRNFLGVIEDLSESGQRIEIVDGDREVKAISEDILSFVADILGAPRSSRRTRAQSSGSKQIAAILEGEAIVR